nr:immunoglobulin light chain junction region [Macaca mulatta]
CQHYHTTPYSF